MEKKLKSKYYIELYEDNKEKCPINIHNKKFCKVKTLYVNILNHNYDQWKMSQDFPGPQPDCTQCGIQSRWKDRCIWLLGQYFETVVCFLGRVSQDFPGPHRRCVDQCGFQSRWKDRCIWLGRHDFETVVCFLVESVSRLSRVTSTG